MKVAFVQDWLTVDGGAEKVAKEIINCFNDVDVFCLVDDLSDKDRKEIIKGKSTTTSFIQKLPFGKKAYRNYFPLFPKAIESLDFTGYDLIVSSSYSVAKGLKKTSKNQIHICYCHSPIRYAWDLQEEYLSHVNGVKRVLARIFLSYIRKWDLKTANRPDYYITNSYFVAERIKRIYNRDATVIYPPIDTTSFSYVEQKEDYYFTSARMVPYKKIDLIVKAFAQLPNLRLVVSGDGPEYENLKRIATDNVEFIGFVSKASLIDYTQRAKAFILAAEEDFGITSIEAQSCGTPVIALKKGGYLETVIENKTGVFFNEQTAQSIAETINLFENKNTKFVQEDFMKNVTKFSIERFKNEFKSFVKNNG
ncbi:MAG: glycosyltransferase [Flavobacteriales bacterium]|nr:glycosyltransferase [Flavobacteriales bacterium]MCB9363347.1 glycosyltransferase [Flavobacteriales bacterium]